MAPRLVSNCLIGEDLFPMVRTPGRHVSTAIRRVMQRMHPTRFTDDLPNQLRLNLGNAFEQALIDALARQYPNRYHRLGTQSFRGIEGTPDLIDTEIGGDPGDPSKWGVTEVKLTWASAKRAVDIEDEWFWHYWAQIKPYAKMMGVNRGGLIVCFINGDYTYGDKGGPTAYEWQDEFTDSDLDEAWAMVEMYATVEDAIKKGAVKSKPVAPKKSKGKR